MEDMFPRLAGVDYSKLKVTEEGSYSITRRRDADQIIHIIKNTVSDYEIKSITDATGCIGGDTLNFATMFEKVHSIELNTDNFEALKNNVGVYGFTNISLYHGDCTEVYKWASDVLYIDPPWGGPNYRTIQNLNLYLGNIRLDDWLEDILSGPYRPSHIFLKVPLNYNTKPLQFLTNIKSISMHRIRTYMLVHITVQ
jgi:tRNA G37 N-methylase Trm5